MFNITKFSCQRSDFTNSFSIVVEWTCSPEDLGYFGNLNKYHTEAVLQVEPAVLEDHMNNLPAITPEQDFVEQDGVLLWNPSVKNSYELGYLKQQLVEGTNKIQVVEGEENTYRYQEWVVDNQVTRAITFEIAMMQQKINSGLKATFRSANPTHDFATLILALDAFWS